MALTAIDWTIIVGFFAINLGIGIYYARRTGKNVGEYFLSGRAAPWWLAGTSMVATTFAVDTPLAVTGFVHDNGIAGNWLWWNMAASGCLTVFFFAALWRRSGVLTDVEFIELRYGGTAASALRAVRAVFQGVLVNTIVMGWVNLAMAKILTLTLHVDKGPAILVCLALTAIYVTIGGFWSVLVTDLLQFVVKMTMAVVLAVAAVAAVGGIGTLRAKLGVLDAAHGGASVLAFFPGNESAWMPLTTFLVFIGVTWWASSYPGAEPGGGSYIAQRIFAARSERDSVFATLFFNVAHYGLRPWPWILVALCALVLYPHGVAGPGGKPDPELGYVQTLIDYLPGWLRGLMMAGFLAAYMSTIGTHLNLGASYFTNDLYRRFFRPHDSEAHYVTVSRWMTVVCVILAAIVTQFMTSVGDAWKYMLTLTAGVGPVMILRWYWWRMSAWSEIAALAASATVGSALYLFDVFPGDDPNATAKRLLVTVVCTTATWLIVTFVTKPESDATLWRFFVRVRPAGGGWRRFAARAGGNEHADQLGIALIDWVAALALVYGTLFGIGKLVLGEPVLGAGWLALALAALAVILRNVNAIVRPPAVAGTEANERSVEGMLPLREEMTQYP
jgi:Na+/proline symporter